MYIQPLSASLLGSLDLANDAVFGWLQTFAIDVATWTMLAHRAEIAGTSTALSFRRHTPMLWRDIPSGAYAVIGRYDHGGVHYAIPRAARLPDFAGASRSPLGDGVASVP